MRFLPPSPSIFASTSTVFPPVWGAFAETVIFCLAKLSFMMFALSRAKIAADLAACKSNSLSTRVLVVKFFGIILSKDGYSPERRRVKRGFSYLKPYLLVGQVAYNKLLILFLFLTHFNNFKKRLCRNYHPLFKC